MTSLVALMDAHGGVAAWVQAIGAIVALGVTIALSRRDKNERKKFQLARGRSAAVALFPVLMDILVQLTWALDQVAAGNRPDEIGNDGPNGEHIIRFWHTQVMPERLIALHPLLHELGDAAEATQRAYFALQRLKQDFRDFARLQQFDGPEEIWAYSDTEWEATHKLARNAQRLLDEAIGAISAYLK